jgi:surface protein
MCDYGLYYSVGCLEDKIIPSNICGIWGTVNWYIDDNTLHLSGGQGVSISKYTESYPHWYDYNSLVTKIIIHDKAILPSLSGGIFTQLHKVKTIKNLDKLDTHKVISMSSMFSGCSKLTHLDISHFDMSKVKDKHLMFNT